MRGERRYSIRERIDRSFRIVHDGAMLSYGEQPYCCNNCISTGVFATTHLAEEEMNERLEPGRGGGHVSGRQWSTRYRASFARPSQMLLIDVPTPAIDNCQITRS